MQYIKKGKQNFTIKIDNLNKINTVISVNVKLFTTVFLLLLITSLLVLHMNVLFTCYTNLPIGRQHFGTFPPESHRVEGDDNNSLQHGVA